MADFFVRTLTDSEWEIWRDVRLAALQDAPEAFVGTYAEESQYGEQEWLPLMQRSKRLVAVVDDQVVGCVSLRNPIAGNWRPGVIELFGLWVQPQYRGKGVSWSLVRASVRQGRADGKARVLYWVGTDNGPAVAFASSFGFMPSDHRRPMQGRSLGDSSVEQMAMFYALGMDPAQVPSALG